MNEIEYDITDIRDIKSMISMMITDAETDIENVDTNDLINRKPRDLVEDEWIENRDEWQKLSGTDDMSDKMIHDLFIAAYKDVYVGARWNLI